MEFTDVTDNTQNLLTATTVEMAVLKHTIVYLPHLLLVYSLQSGALGDITRRQSLDTEGLREIVRELYPTVDIAYPADKFDATVLNVVDSAKEWVKDDGSDVPRLVRPDHVFIKMLELEDPDLLYVLEQAGADPVQMMHEALVVRADLDRLRSEGVGD